MAEQNDFNDYLPEQKPEEYSIEVPADQAPLNLDRVPSGQDIMGRIEQRGIAYSRLARGLAPWWVLVSGWVVFGGLALGLLKMGLAGSIVSWVLLVIVILPLIILAQGTLAKLSSN
ncbi:hypothetical protein [Phormidium sp. FACHB-1136]|jgi:hypothetical protein|uniref:hypothetical protein n=1 Tax=Phormidium sp. FACHB-1136 TaxID=2692848 RepID=UPI0016869737|nr:hypothetical protein [Phormidium sp. FACHB-1136]MBD2425798.1 hypothetical protein [Phormidium sp. FACHB-1136]